MMLVMVGESADRHCLRCRNGIKIRERVRDDF